MKWTRGTPSFFRSSNMAQRGFCKDCGTPLTYSFDGNGRISVTINSLDDPEAMPPTKQYGNEGEVSWLKGIHDLPAPAHRGVDEERHRREIGQQSAQLLKKRAGGNAMESLQVPRPAWMTEDLVLLEEQAQRFLATELVPHIEKWTEDGIMERSAWDKLGQAGLLCASMPEEYGGAGGSFAHETVINRAIAHAGLDCIGAPLHSGIVAPYILNYGTEEQKKNWLPKLATGEMIGAIAMSEPGTGSDLQGVKTTAKKSGNGYVLNGSKTFITNGQHANLIIVVAKTDPARARRAPR